MAVTIDLTHQRFGKLFVLAKTDLVASNGHSLWACHCDCGNFCLTKSSALRKNNKRDCGCEHIKTCRNSKVKHGYKGTKFIALLMLLSAGVMTKTKTTMFIMVHVVSLFVMSGETIERCFVSG